MKHPFPMLMVKGATIGYIPIVADACTIERKSNIWTQVNPFKKPARGLIGFNFSKEDNRLLGIELYYAKLCLSNQYVEYAEYFQDKERMEILFDAFPGVTTFYFSGDDEGARMTQTMEVALPAAGTAVIDFRDEKLVCLELVGFDCSLEKSDE